MQRSFEENIQRYAHLVIASGCNLQKGQELYLAADVGDTMLARALVREAYRQGAGNVTVRWTDELCTRMDYLNRPLASFATYPDWLATLQNGSAQRGAALLFISSEDPEAYVGIDQRKLVAFVRAKREACKPWSDSMDFSRNAWCIIGGASPRWARRVFPELPADEAVRRLWDAIFTATRVDTPDPVAAWEKHRTSFDRRKAQLNSLHIDSLHYESSLGTDFTVGLTPRSIWEGGGSVTQAGRPYFPNMPTEEVFTSPDRNRADGTLVASMPLSYAGSPIEGLSLTFENGRITDFSADRDVHILEQMIGTDEGSHHLGEVALIPKTSPIKRAGVLFLNTLFDENAACHMAIGMGFPDCYEGGLEMTKDELQEAGINDSAIHVDFMIGTDDLHVVATCADGREVEVFRDGTWAFDEDVEF